MTKKLLNRFAIFQRSGIFWWGYIVLIGVTRDCTCMRRVSVKRWFWNDMSQKLKIWFSTNFRGKLVKIDIWKHVATTYLVMIQVLTNTTMTVWMSMFKAQQWTWAHGFHHDWWMTMDKLTINWMRKDLLHESWNAYGCTSKAAYSTRLMVFNDWWIIVNEWMKNEWIMQEQGMNHAGARNETCMNNEWNMQKQWMTQTQWMKHEWMNAMNNSNHEIHPLRMMKLPFPNVQYMDIYMHLLPKLPKCR